MKVIRTGITRTVVLTNRYAIKVPSLRGGCYGRRNWFLSFCRGVLANDSERQFSGLEGLNPVLWSLGGVVNVYRRAEILKSTWIPEKWYEGIAPDLQIIGDRKTDNIGLVDGKLVWIDYDFSWNGCNDHK